MLRISSLPIAERCPASTSVPSFGTINSARGTAFHERCEVGAWGPKFRALSDSDKEEISKWEPPSPLMIGGKEFLYSKAQKEVRVSLGWDGEYLDLSALAQEEIELRQDVSLSGTADMLWVADGVIVVGDIKSSIYAASDGADSLQLLGYGLCAAKKHGAACIIPAIWDASDGRWYVGKHLSGGDLFDLEVRCLDVAAKVSHGSAELVTGVHCRGCWRRRLCPAHRLPESGNVSIDRLLSNASEPTASEVRSALTEAKKLHDISSEVELAAKAWAIRHGGLLSEDGGKVWKASLVKGRRSLDVEALLEASGLERGKFETNGKDYERWEWKKR